MRLGWGHILWDVVGTEAVGMGWGWVQCSQGWTAMGFSFCPRADLHPGLHHILLQSVLSLPHPSLSALHPYAHSSNSVYAMYFSSYANIRSEITFSKSTNIGICMKF